MKSRNALAAALLASLVAGRAAAQEDARPRLAAIMDSVFGAGAWRVTGGYRTPGREAELRRQGAMTVRPGGLSRHSVGSPDAPGAYDIVVAGMSPFEAADRLRRAGAPFARYMPKGAHGTQGPHLHLEPYTLDLRTAGASPPVILQAGYVKPSGRRSGGDALIAVVEGVARKRSAPDAAPAQPAAPPPEANARPEDLITRLRTAAVHDDGQAQLELGRAYLSGEGAPRDLKSAVKWLNLAASNPKAEPRIRDEAAAALDKLADGLEGDMSLRLARRDP